MKLLYKLSVMSGLFLFAQLAFAAEELTGTVAETISVNNYIYVLLEENDTWLATLPVEVSVGDRIEYAGGMPMKDFYSSELERTFEEILFITKIEVVGSADPHGALAGSHKPGAMGKSAPSPAAGEIALLDDGKTIAEIQAGSAELAGTQAILRARVMKVSLNILGKNWITLQDGTGTAPDNKLIATTSESVEVGETVIVKGIVQTNVDIGSGYKYKVVIQEATFSK